MSISDDYHLILKAKEYLSTDDGKAELKLRSSVERVNGVLKNRFGLGVTKSWGANKYKIQGYWSAIAYNVSRTVKLLNQREQQALGCT
ncbi:MAG: transposase [Dehalococcoidia bacterium]